MMSIPLNSALNRSLMILWANGQRAEVVELNPPIALIRIQDSHTNPIMNTSIIANNPTTMINGTAYILLSESENIPAPPRHSFRTSIKIYVNGFEAKSLDMDLINGKTYNLTLDLKRLNVEITHLNEEVLEKLNLRINGTNFRHEKGLASYMLPPGEYLIKAEAPGFEASTKVTLFEDSTVKLKLMRTMSIEDTLKLSASVELICAIFLAYVNHKNMKHPKVKYRTMCLKILRPLERVKIVEILTFQTSNNL